MMARDEEGPLDYLLKHPGFLAAWIVEVALLAALEIYLKPEKEILPILAGLDLVVVFGFFPVINGLVYQVCRHRPKKPSVKPKGKGGSSRP